MFLEKINTWTFKKKMIKRRLQTSDMYSLKVQVQMCFKSHYTECTIYKINFCSSLNGYWCFVIFYRHILWKPTIGTRPMRWAVVWTRQCGKRVQDADAARGVVRLLEALVTWRRGDALLFQCIQCRLQKIDISLKLWK